MAAAAEIVIAAVAAPELGRPAASCTDTVNVPTLVPELGVKFGYNFTEHLRGYVGYDVLYASNVVRPGDQVDTFVNSSFIPPRGTPVGAPLPHFQFRTTDFWAQGVSFGLELRY